MMITIKNNSDTMIIVLHEIYGINPFIKGVCDNFGRKGYNVICPNFLNTNQFYDYNQEETAYQNFIKNIGFESVSLEIKKLIIDNRRHYKFIYLVGFSIGATIAWLCSNESNLCTGVIGYYGSRIRDYLDIKPRCPVLLFFPSEEKSFKVEELIVSLQNESINIHVLNGKHGFCDQFNKYYNEQSYKEAENITNNFLNRVKE